MTKAYRCGLLTGGFDPLHSGHVEMILDAQRHCDALYVGVNDDDWLIAKKGFCLLPARHRMAVIGAMRGVWKVFCFASSDGTACNALRTMREQFMNPGDSLIFMNGGDRRFGAVPEAEIDLADEVRFGIGGESKDGSSSAFFLRAVSQMANHNSVLPKVT